MKVLWITTVPLQKGGALDTSKQIFGGWVAQLYWDIKDKVNLSVCVPDKKNEIMDCKNIDGTNYYFYYPCRLYTYSHHQEKRFREILKKENPDVIHIWGTETSTSLAIVNAAQAEGMIEKTIIDIQGIATYWAYHFGRELPRSIMCKWTLRDIMRMDNLNMQYRKILIRSKFEKEAFSKIHHVFGRTDWDYACAMQLNPKILYHHNSRLLRKDFLNGKWNLDSCERYSIFCVNSPFNITKGFHHIIRALPEILNLFPGAHIYATGLNPHPNNFKKLLKQSSYQRYLSSLIRKMRIEDKITFCGDLDAIKMKERYLKSHVFISAASNENLSNAIGEAMMLGVPILSSDAGGIKTIFTHMSDGLLYQSDAPYLIADGVCRIFNNNKLALRFSQNASNSARKAYNSNKNVLEILDNYRKIGQK